MRSKLFPAAAALAIFAVSALPSSPASAATFVIDRAHSSVSFGVRHLLSQTKGKFANFEGRVEMDAEKRDSIKVTGSIEAASIDTGDEERDKHLRGADFFDVAKFPTITFQASELTDVNAERNKGKLKGQLTMHGVTKPIIIDVRWFGIQKDPWGNLKAGFSGVTTLNRKDFGIEWNKALDAGGLLIGEDVKIELNLEAYVK